MLISRAMLYIMQHCIIKRCGFVTSSPPVMLCREAIGDHVHTVAAIGSTQTSDLAAELNLDGDWVEAGPDVEKLSIREQRAATPMLLVTDSDRVVANARGWWLGGRSLLLERPVESEAELTPELARWVLTL